MNYIAKIPTTITALISKTLFFEIYGFPFAILCLIASGVFFSFKLGFPAQKYFKKSFKKLLHGDEKNEKNGLMGGFYSLLTSLSTIIGAGNVIGVAAAIIIGGPGSVFWMVLIAFFGMNLSFAETLLACKYKKIDLEKKDVSCAPIIYIKESLKDINFAKLGKILSMMFAVMYPIGLIGSIIFQTSNMAETIASDITFLQNYKFLVAVVLLSFIIVVAHKGITGVAKFSSSILSLSCCVYLFFGSIIILMNITKIPSVLFMILKDAFNMKSAVGGILVSMAIGAKRGAYSNEAGLGAATTPYAALSGKNNVDKALLGALNPFFDTIIICLFSALVILLSGSYVMGGQNPDGVILVKNAFSTLFPLAKYVVSFFITGVFFSLTFTSFFNLNNVIREFFGKKFIFVFYVIEVVLIASSTILNFTQIIDIADTLYLAIMVPNLICLFLNRNNIKNIYLKERN